MSLPTKWKGYYSGSVRPKPRIFQSPALPKVFKYTASQVEAGALGPTNPAWPAQQKGVKTRTPNMKSRKR